ncbi:unnamed protein product [Rotaria sp. Silwood2]|nr:unnamed protein product [Rotaria sp. Silwood2]CAF3389023.1 unnamed protein product [Rotaria sp. Silwood2]CAF4227086.1 unnamed protein product [Rotaria sp. Silwood2]CAF4362538.1 unnamed protein product [Rotaria sp. Silwood2]
MDRAASTLRLEHEKPRKITIIIDNAKWHSKFTPESDLPKRAWRKQLFVVCTRLPPKEFLVDKLASKYDVEIVRILVKRCVLNPLKRGWARLKNYVRQQNVHFNLNDIQQLCNECLSVCGHEHTAGYFAHDDKHEEIFKAADKKC